MTSAVMIWRTQYLQEMIARLPNDKFFREFTDKWYRPLSFSSNIINPRFVGIFPFWMPHHFKDINDNYIYSEIVLAEWLQWPVL